MDFNLPLLHLFSVFFKQLSIHTFYNKLMGKIFHLVYITGIRTHNLHIANLITYVTDFCGGIAYKEVKVLQHWLQEANLN